MFMRAQLLLSSSAIDPVAINSDAAELTRCSTRVVSEIESPPNAAKLRSKRECSFCLCPKRNAARPVAAASFTIASR